MNQAIFHRNVESYEKSKCQNCAERWLSLVNQVKSLQTKKLISKRGESGFHPYASVTSCGTTDQPKDKTKTKTDKDKDKNKDNKEGGKWISSFCHCDKLWHH